MSATGKKNIREIAKVCGVSPTTVSRVLNNKPDVSEAVRKKVLAAIRELNYMPTVVPRKTNILGVTVEFPYSLMSPYLSTAVSTIQDTAFDMGYEILLLRNERLRESIDNYQLLFRQRMLSGLIMLLTSVEDTFPVKIAEEGIPHVVLSNRPPEPTTYIDTDSYGGSFEATKHLISLGHRRIAFSIEGYSHQNHRDRLRGYREALESEAIPASKDLVVPPVGRTSDEVGHNFFKTVFAREPRITAVILASGRLPGFLACARDHGVHVPEDLSVIVFDDSSFAKYSSPSFTVVSQEVEVVARMAVQEVVRQINEPAHETPPKRLVLPTHLVLRDSTAPLREPIETGRS